MTATVGPKHSTFVYDGRGFVTSETHPEIGAGGNGTTTTPTTPARGNALTRGLPGTAFDLAYTYDAAGRLVAIHEDAGDRPLKTFAYARANAGGEKRAGKLAQARRYNYRPLDGGADDTVVVTQEYRYDTTVGRVAERQTRIANLASDGHEAFTTGFTWDATGNPGSIVYPDCLSSTCPVAEPARTVSHQYTFGFLTAIPGVALDFDYQAGGMLGMIEHQNGVHETIAIHPTTRMARPHKITTTNGASPWDTGVYQYDGSGNIKAIGTLSFEYDRLHRLVSGEAQVGAATKVQQVSYDRMGNVMSLTAGGVLRPTTTALATNHMFDGTYDDAGNLTSISLDGVGYQYGYDALSMMSTLQFGTDARVFVYDADDERILTLDCNAPNDCEDPATHETWTLRGLGGKVLRVYDRPWSADFTWQRDYVYRNGQPLATIEATTGGGSRALHLHLDHLGSVRQVTDAFGVQVALHSYYPFGEEATSGSQDEVKLKFTGHERELGSEHDYMHARFFASSFGRFTSPDPSRSSRDNEPQSWNRYVYVHNRPLVAMDPTGLVLKFYDSYSATGEDLRATINQLLSGSGYVLIKVPVGRFGSRLELVENGRTTDATRAQLALVNTLSVAIEAKETVALTAVSADPTVVLDQYISGKVDIADILAVGDGAGVSDASLIAHVVGEQTAKSVLRLPNTRAGHDRAHPFALGARRGVTGEARVGVSGSLDRTQSGRITGTYQSTTGPYDVDIHFVNGNVDRVIRWK